MQGPVKNTAKRPSSDDVPASERSKKQRMAEAPETMDIDENLHSRQLAVYGREAFRKFQTASVLVAGMNALGVEVGEYGHWRADRGGR
jgi:ubiquitin-activating enzyme E1